MDNPVWLLPLLLLLLPGRSAAGPAAPAAAAAAATASSPLPDQLTVAMRHIEQSCLDKCADQVSAPKTASSSSSIASIPPHMIWFSVSAGAERSVACARHHCFFAL